MTVLTHSENSITENSITVNIYFQSSRKYMFTVITPFLAIIINIMEKRSTVN